MAENKGVIIFAEVKDGKLAAITTELLGCGRKLADNLGQGLSAILAGSKVGDLAKEVIAFGADEVFVADDPALENYQTDAYVPVVESLAKQAMPQIILFGQTSIGRDLAPRLAFRLQTAAAMDCVDLAIDQASKRLLQTRPVYGGNAQATFTCQADPQIATVRAKAMSPLERNASKQGKVTAIKVTLPAVRAKVLQKVKEEVEGIKLEDAPTVISGGRGIGGNEGFKQLEELAKMLKGAVGASRPACDNGWVPDTMQVGLTGKIVAPDLYVAIGISGSSQHMSGCSGSKNIIAINKDPEANIFKVSRYGVVGDWKKVLPAFTQKVKELLAG